MKYMMNLILTFLVATITIHEGQTSNRYSYKMEKAQARVAMKNADAVYRKVQKAERIFAKSKMNAPVMRIHLSRKQLFHLLPLFIVAACVGGASAQVQADAYVDCDELGYCYNPGTNTMEKIFEPSRSASLLECAPFINPHKLPSEKQYSLGWQLALKAQLPKVGEELDHRAICKNYPHEDRSLVVKSFNEKIAEKVVSATHLARQSGKKIGIILGVLQDKCASLYQQIQLYKLGRYLDISHVIYPMAKSDLLPALTSAQAFINPKSMPNVRPGHKATANLSGIGYGLAFNYSSSVVHSTSSFRSLNANYLISLKRIADLYNGLQTIRRRKSPHDQELMTVMQAELENLVKVSSQCPDFFAQERDFARQTQSYKGDFIMFLGESALAPFLEVFNSTTHSLLMIRPTKDMGGHVSGSLNSVLDLEIIPGKKTVLVSRECADQFNRYVKSFEHSANPSYPCVLHPVVNDEIMTK